MASGRVLVLGLGPGNTVLDKSFDVTLSVLNVMSRVVSCIPYGRRVGGGGFVLGSWMAQSALSSIMAQRYN